MVKEKKGEAITSLFNDGDVGRRKDFLWEASLSFTKEGSVEVTVWNFLCLPQKKRCSC